MAEERQGGGRRYGERSYGEGGEGRGRDREGGRGGGRMFRRKVCSFCVDKVDHVSYKDVPRLRRLVSDRGKIFKSRMTGTCQRHQRTAAKAIKRARHLALLPFAAE